MFKAATALLPLTLATGLTAFADFSYTMTQKTTGGSMAAMAGTAADRTTKNYLKGQKLLTGSSDVSTIIDFGAQTVTTLNHAQKTYSVKKFGEAGAAGASNTNMTFDVKDTGQKKTINGFNASETVMTMNMDMDMGRGQAMKMTAEMDLWVSPDVPGASQMRDFFQKNAANFPWEAMMGAGGAGNQSMQKAIGQMQRKMSELNGMVVEMVIRVKPAGGAAAVAMPQMPQMTPAQQAQMQAAMAQMQEMAKQGGPAAAAAQQAMGRMGSMGRGAAAPSGGGDSLIEITEDASAFSSASVPDSVFDVPAGYKKLP